MTRLVQRKMGAAAAIDAEVLKAADVNLLRLTFAQVRATLVKGAERRSATLAPGGRIRYMSTWETIPEYRGLADGERVHYPERRVLYVRAWGSYLVPEEEV